MKRRIYNNSSKRYNPPLWLRVLSKYRDWKITGQFLGIEKESPYRDMGIFNSQSTEYDELEKIFRNYSISDKDVFVDVGCGTGRVFAYLLNKGMRCRMVGVEMNSDLVQEDKINFERYPCVSFIAGDAVSLVPMDATVLYLYNPFDFSVFQRFIASVEEKFSHLRIIYYNLKFADFFEGRGNWHIELMPVKSIARKKVMPCAFLEYNRRTQND